MSSTVVLLRAHERALFAAAVALMIAGIIATLLQPSPTLDRAFAREEGALLAPGSDALFTDAWGRPAAPPAVVPGSAGSVSPDGPPDPEPAPSPPQPGPPEPPVEPPPDDGFLPDLPILPPLPLPSLLGPVGGGR